MPLLALMRHGEAIADLDDTSRRLTERGRRESEAIARFAGSAGIRFRRIVHSRKLRAVESAEILARFSPGAVVEERDGLQPNDEPALFADELAHEEGAVAIVGHLPFLGRLAAILTTGSDRFPVVHFSTSALVVLERIDSLWTITLAVSPEAIDQAR